MHTPELSVVVPVYNEEAGLPALFDRLYSALDALRTTYEVVFVNDGSTDRSAALLRQRFQERPEVTRVVLFNGNFGQHMAIMAGFAQVRGRRVVTLDADLQNPPEEIARLLERMDAGHDYVGTIRRDRQDSFFRRVASRAMNRVRERITRIHMTDQGCMMRAYSREIVDAMGSSREVNTFIPALAYTFAANPTEILVAHEERHAGTSKYPLSKLLRLNFDLITGFSIVPLQAVSVIGMLISVMAATMFLLLVLRRLFIGPEAEGIFSLFAVNFLLHGMELLGLGLLGEYVGRVYLQVRERPRYLIQAILEERPAAPAAEPRAP